MDEAAAKLRVALYSMPDDLKQEIKEIDRLAAEEEQAGVERDYERAVKLRLNVCAWKKNSKRNAPFGKRSTNLMTLLTQMILPLSFTSGLAFL
jgi:ATP-dependent Clp protease ATP-binding subunit ClpA